LSPDSAIPADARSKPGVAKTTFKTFKLFKAFKTFGTIGTIGTLEQLEPVDFRKGRTRRFYSGIPVKFTAIFDGPWR
jgi:hypothetical protein